MKFGRPLAIIVHYTVHINLGCCKSFVPDMGPNTILKILIKIKRCLKSEIKNISNIQSFLKFGRPLAIIVHYMVQFNLACCKSSVPNMAPNIILKILKFIKRRLKSES